ncbi:MAG: hypothetical protein RL120_08185 [Gammaproteobacteria bacterium]
MRITSITKKSLLVISIALVSPFVTADDSVSARTIASILADLNHFPSDEAKTQLMAIESDGTTSGDFKTIARAVHDLQHTVGTDSRDDLNDIASDDNADPTARELAQIVMNIEHTADEAAKARLQELR